MCDNEDIEQLVRELKDLQNLQIKQAAIIEKIQTAERKRKTSNTTEFAPGDKIVIINRTNPPSGAKPSKQDKTGTVISVTAKRIQIRTDSGVNTSRAPHNLRKTTP